MAIDDDAWFRLDDAYLHVDENTNAFDAYVKLLSTNPTYDGVCSCLVHAFRCLGPTDFAIASMENIASQPKVRSCPLVLSALGRAYVERGEPQNAMHAFHRAVRAWPESADDWISLGELYVETKHTDEALTAFQRAVDLNPETSDPWEKLAKLFERSSPTGQELYEVLNIPPDSAGWFYLAFAYRNLNLPEKEIYTFKQSLRSSPNDDFSWALLDKAYRTIAK